jgi:hypothetical protein
LVVTRGRGRAARRKAKKPAGDFVQRGHAVDRSSGDGLLRHAEYERGRFVLRHRSSASASHGEQPLGSIIAHSGKDRAHGLVAQRLRA